MSKGDAHVPFAIFCSLFFPVSHLLPLWLPDKTLAVFLAEPIADLLAVATTVTLFRFRFRAIMAPLPPEQ